MLGDSEVDDDSGVEDRNDKPVMAAAWADRRMNVFKAVVSVLERLEEEVEVVLVLVRVPESCKIEIASALSSPPVAITN